MSEMVIGLALGLLLAIDVGAQLFTLRRRNKELDLEAERLAAWSVKLDEKSRLADRRLERAAWANRATLKLCNEFFKEPMDSAKIMKLVAQVEAECAWREARESAEKG